MPKEINGTMDARGLRIAIVVSRFNGYITSKLLEGALETFKRHNGVESDLSIVHVPGAFEIPLAAQTLAGSGDYSAIVCLGAVIRGDTPHFDYVCAESARGMTQASLTTGVPVINGVLTTNDSAQAIERAGLKSGNKGADAMAAAIEMASVMKRITPAIKPVKAKVE